jgi:glycosyltransferase involved in cell wall biosynthesis
VRLAMFTGGRYVWDGGHRYYTRSNWRRALLYAYAQEFGAVRLFCRATEGDLSASPADEIFSDDVIEVVRLPSFYGRIGYLRCWAAMKRLIEAGLVGCDVCFLRVPDQVSALGIRVARKLGVRTVCQLVGDAEDVFRSDETLVKSALLRPWAAWHARRYQYSVTNQCDGCISVSRALAAKYCRDPAEAAIIPNTRLTDEWFVPPRRRGSEEPLRVLYVGRLEHHKNPQLLLRAAARLSSRQRNLVVELAGDGRYRGALEREADALGLRRIVRFLGHIGDPAQLRECYGRAHVLALLSFTEGMPMVLIEGGAAGLPCVASRRGGIPDVAHEGENAFLVEPDDPDGCAAALARLYDDDPLRFRMAERSQALAREYTLVRIAQRARAAIGHVMEGRPAAGGDAER